jgi:predicted aspartyl protease
MIKKMASLLPVLALLLALVPPIGARADDAAGLLAKHKAFVGWQFGDGSVNTFALDGQIIRPKNGVDTAIYTFHELHSGTAWRSDDHDVVKGTDSSSGFTGRLYWRTNANGFIRPELGDLQKRNIAFDLLFNEATTGFQGTATGTRQVDGVDCTVVRISPDVSFPIDLYIDSQTGAYKRAVIDPDGTYESTIDVVDYMDAGSGKKFIGKWHFHDDTALVELTKVTLNPTISTEALHPPAQTAQWTFASGKPFPIQFVDSDATHDHAIYVDGMVNGVKGHFIMDTGASSFFFTQEFADRAHIKRVDSSQASGVGGDIKTSVNKADTIQLGDNVLSNVIVDSGKVDFPGFDGLIGFDLFAGAIVHVDIDARQMTIYDPKTSVADKNAGFALTVDLSQEVPSIPMKVNGSIDVEALLDSGNSGNIDFATALKTRYGLKMLVDNSPQGYLQSHQSFGGVGGVETDTCGRLDSVAVGPISYTDAPACESPSFSGREILVGFDFLKNFNLIFDYPEAQLILIPRKQ